MQVQRLGQGKAQPATDSNKSRFRRSIVEFVKMRKYIIEGIADAAVGFLPGAGHSQRYAIGSSVAEFPIRVATIEIQALDRLDQRE